MARYASDTDVPADRSIAQLQATIRRYGATGFMQGWTATEAVVAFEMENRRVMFRLPMPDRQSDEFTRTHTGRERSVAQAEKAYDQAIRQRWRALNLVVKAKLEAVESGITTFDTELVRAVDPLVPGRARPPPRDRRGRVLLDALHRWPAAARVGVLGAGRG